MQVGVGFSENPDTEAAAVNAVRRAFKQAGRRDPCDLVLLFSTAYHDARYLHEVVKSIVGQETLIVGGGAIGAIVNDRYGYAGEQIGLALVWFGDVRFELFTKGGLVDNEERVGYRLGVRMSERKVTRDTPVVLLYDAIDRSGGDVRLNLATPLLRGLERGLGFLPSTMVGAGLQGDFESSATLQWNGAGAAARQAMLMAFFGDLKIDSVIMHGCKPFGEYYTVTKADKQTILEVNGEPALPFIQSRLKPSLPVEEFPFFMIFGVNLEPGSEFNEKNYANRLCLDIDRKRNGIVMFESDMVEGTRFQIMYRSLNLEYIPPKIEQAFSELNGRRPVFAMYINCAGRASRIGDDHEDAVIVQKTVGGRVPLLGIYSGVEIAPINNVPRTLDWTGVFCLFSEPS